MFVVLYSGVEERSTKTTKFYNSSEMDAAPLDYGAFMTKFRTCLQAEWPRLWVFGYGSLLWKPGFEYTSYRVGYVENFERKFNQGNETFRGTKSKPGRVANLEEKQGAKVWGLAYEICGHNEVTEVLQNLYQREIAHGSYKVTMTTFHPRKCNKNSVRDIDNKTKCCSQNHHNISLPHPPCSLSNPLRTPSTESCSLSKCHQSQTTENLSHCSSSPASLSLSWLNSYDSSCQKYVEAENCCPCFAPTNTECFSRQTRDSNCGQNKSFQNCEYQRPSHNISDENTLSEKTENSLLTRKTSFDYANSMKLTKNNSHHIDSNLSEEYHNLTLESRLFNLHMNKTNEHNTHSRPTYPHEVYKGNDPNFTTTASDAQDNPHADEAPIEVLLFTVTEENSLYLGSDDVDKMAKQIIEARGKAGTNVEYVIRISDFIKTFIPEDDDKHLFHLDYKIREELFYYAEAEVDLDQMGSNVPALQQRDHVIMRRRINS